MSKISMTLAALLLLSPLVAPADAAVEPKGSVTDLKTDETPDASIKQTTEADASGEAPSEPRQESRPSYSALDALFDDMWNTAGRMRTSWLRPSLFDMLSDFSSGYYYLHQPRQPDDGTPRRYVSQVTLRPVASDDSSVVFAANLAGVPKENVNITIDSEGLLTVEASQKEELSEGGRRVAHEYSYFAQRQLPFGVDASRVKSDYKDGMLRITVPKPSKDDVTRVAIA